MRIPRFLAGALVCVLAVVCSASTYYVSATDGDDAVSNKDIVDDEKFRDGLNKVIDGTVQCLNASIWAKAGK